MTPKQRAFVNEYAVDLNATAAAKRAGYSPKTAMQIGEQNLRKVEIKAAIKVSSDARAARTEITADKVLRELAKIGFGDVRDLFTSEGHIRRVEDMEPTVSAIIQSIEVVVRKADDGTATEHTAKIKLWDKLSALDKMGCHLGLFAEAAAKSNEANSIAAESIKQAAADFDRKIARYIGLEPGVPGTPEGLALRAAREDAF
jgi:phage terminase small subunit